jgi:hypothetical protein
VTGPREQRAEIAANRAGPDHSDSHTPPNKRRPRLSGLWSVARTAGMLRSCAARVKASSSLRTMSLVIVRQYPDGNLAPAASAG